MVAHEIWGFWTMPPSAGRGVVGRGRPPNSQPGRLRYVTRASAPASSGSVPLPVWWRGQEAPRFGAECGRKDKLQAPTSKLQRSFKDRAPNAYVRRFECWSLVLLWCLELGV